MPESCHFWEAFMHPPEFPDYLVIPVSMARKLRRRHQPMHAATAAADTCRAGLHR